MKLEQALDRQVNFAGMLWLLAAQIAVVMPFLAYLPVWLILVLFACAAWRIRVLRGHWAEPPWQIKAGLIVLGVTALAFSGLAPLSLDTMASLLLLGFGFKSLEVIHRRDAVVVVYIGYFLVAVQFLYSQSIGAALYGVACLVILTAALIAAQQSPNKKISDHLKLAGVMLLQCLPLMIVVYLFFPRLPPLWSVSMPSTQATTGISDSMAPGDIAQLSQSAAPAFRVSFKGQRPKQHQLYWRGLVLNHFDGREWTQFAESMSDREIRQRLRINPLLAASQLEMTDQPVEYEAIYEATEQPWLFTLSPVIEWQGDAVQGFDYRLMAKRTLHAPYALSATSTLEAIRDFNLNPRIRQLALQLPAAQNPQSRALAKQWREQAGSDQAYVRKVLDHFREQAFYYTLRPPLAGQTNTIDHFLFESRRGFCSHYSGSFVFMMRAVGIPARVVVGYQGGEWNEEGDYLLVRQYDAHAWTEVWLEDSGWVRTDPTAMVAPSRIEQNLETAVEAEGSFLEQARFSPVRIKWLSGARKKWDAMQYGWRRWVLGYDNSTQTRLFRQLLGEVSIAKLGLAFAGMFGVVLALWLAMLGLTRPQDQRPTELKWYDEFCKRLERHGLKHNKADSPRQFGQVAAQQLPELAPQIQRAIDLFEKLAYQQPTKDDYTDLLAQFRGVVKSI